jgi:hypothetical protein
VEKDQRIKECTLNCPSKRLRRRLWAVLGGYRLRRSRLISWCRTRLPIILCPSGDSNTHQRYINLVYNLCLVQFKSHTRSFWYFRWKVLNLYTGYTDKIPTYLSLPALGGLPPSMVISKIVWAFEMHFLHYNKKNVRFIIFNPKDRKEEGAAWLKIISLRSNHITQQTMLLINSIKFLSFKGIQQSIYHISSNDIPLKVKTLNLAIQFQITWTVEQVTKRWWISSYSPQKTT